MPAFSHYLSSPVNFGARYFFIFKNFQTLSSYYAVFHDFQGSQCYHAISSTIYMLLVSSVRRFRCILLCSQTLLVGKEPRFSVRYLSSRLPHSQYISAMFGFQSSRTLEPCSVKVVLNAFMKKYRPNQPAHSAQADLGRNFSVSL